MARRPVTTLFMLMSLDGKISTGATDEMDVDSDFPLMPGIREGLRQYYVIEQETDLWSMNSGRVQAKLGANEKPFPEKRSPVSFVILDNTHLTARGVEYFTRRSHTFVLVTSNRAHPAFGVRADNLRILYYDALNPRVMLEDLRERFGCERITVQTGGTLNGLFLREKLLDYVDIVIAPALIGGKDTSTLIDGVSLTTRAELSKIGVLRLVAADALEDSYVRLRYRVVG